MREKEEINRYMEGIVKYVTKRKKRGIKYARKGKSGKNNREVNSR